MSATITTTTAATITTELQATDPNYIPRGPVDAQLTFYLPPADGSTPFRYVETPPAGQPQLNYRTETKTVRIQDIRGREDEFHADTHGFEAVRGVQSATTRATFDDDEEIKRVYYPEVKQLLLERVAPEAHKVVIFDHTVRRQDPGASRQPVTFAHGDQTDRAATMRVKLHVEDPEEAERLLQGRYRIINVWRPINGAVQQAPLALGSATSLKEGDMVPVEHRYPNRTGETLATRYSPDIEWYYLSGIDDDERLIIKCSDSREDVAKRTPHTAFVDPRSPPGAKPRESIEVRCLVFG
ncbi:hypothetical protein VTN31DRAFT_1272 [Thermomyces dupontii]|uniref:uncharacterized protein n=1 Tax=Talaromyces thermophilus TaxID=28565 RepID=UPI003742025F